MAKEKEEILAIDEELVCPISIGEARELKVIQKKFIESYFNHRDSMPVEKWLHNEMAEYLPEYSSEEVDQISDEILFTLKIQEEKKDSLKRAIGQGRSKESWFAGEAKKAVSYLSGQEASLYLKRLDDALHTANESLYSTIHTQEGLISRNPNLDGFIAEQYHAQTFNLQAEATGSPYRAKVLEATESGYAKNSVDIVIVDENNKVVKRYQSKYYKDAEATAKAFESGDYRGQRKLVPKGQEQDIEKKVTTVIEAPDGTTSKALSKEQAKELQAEAQNGKWNDLNWDEYKVKDLAAGIGKQAGRAALLGAALGAGFDLAQKVWNDEEIKGEEVLEKAVLTGTDFGVKAATAGALKVAAEKGIIKVIPKGTAAGTVANIAHIAIENVKIVSSMATGKVTIKEGLEKMEQTTVAALAGMAGSIKGTAIGASIGAVFGLAGATIGGFIGGTVGYMAGSEIGNNVVKSLHKIREKSREVVKSFGRNVSNAVNKIESGLHSVWNKMASFL